VLIDVTISGGINVIKKEATKILKYTDPQQKYSACGIKNARDISNNRGQLKAPQQHPDRT
jgi:hypothetical protein